MGKNSASFQCLVLLKTASTQTALASVLVHGVTRENPVLDQSFAETAPKILRFFLLSNLGLYALHIHGLSVIIHSFLYINGKLEFLIIFPKSYA
jgi:hypothetical protein